MSTVWRFTYNAGAGNVNVDFSHLEAARNVMRQNCAVDVQRYKNRLARLYVGPSIWSSINLGIINLGTDTVAKFDLLKAVRVPIRFYYRYNISAAYVKVTAIIPETEKAFAAGGLSTRDLTLKMVETETIEDIYIKLTRSGTVRYLYLNATWNGYTVSATPPAGFVEREAVECLLFDAATDVFAVLNSTFNGLAFYSSLPAWVSLLPTVRSRLFLSRDGYARFAHANSTCNGITVN